MNRLPLLNQVAFSRILARLGGHANVAESRGVTGSGPGRDFVHGHRSATIQGSSHEEHLVVQLFLTTRLTRRRPERPYCHGVEVGAELQVLNVDPVGAGQRER